MSARALGALLLVAGVALAGASLRPRGRSVASSGGRDHPPPPSASSPSSTLDGGAATPRGLAVLMAHHPEAVAALGGHDLVWRGASATYRLRADGTLEAVPSIDLGSRDGRRGYARGLGILNALVDLTTGKVRALPEPGGRRRRVAVDFAGARLLSLLVPTLVDLTALWPEEYAEELRHRDEPCHQLALTALGADGRVDEQRTLPCHGIHHVAVAPDGRWAWYTTEAGGGTLVRVDLASLVATPVGAVNASSLRTAGERLWLVVGSDGDGGLAGGSLAGAGLSGGGPLGDGRTLATERLVERRTDGTLRDAGSVGLPGAHVRFVDDRAWLEQAPALPDAGGGRTRRFVGVSLVTGRSSVVTVEVPPGPAAMAFLGDAPSVVEGPLTVVTEDGAAYVVRVESGRASVATDGSLAVFTFGRLVLYGRGGAHRVALALGEGTLAVDSASRWVSPGTAPVPGNPGFGD